MATGGRRSTKRSLLVTALASVVLIGGVVLAAGLAIVDFRAAGALVLGVAAAWVLVGLVRLARRVRRRVLLAVGLGVVVLLGAALLLVMFLSNTSDFIAEEAPADGAAAPEGEGGAIDPPRAVVTGYRVSARPGVDGEHLLVNEAVVYDVRRGADVVLGGQYLLLPEREITSHSRGFLLREVTIEPLGAGAMASIPVSLDDGTELDLRLCTVLSCPPSEVELQEFPEDAFFAARDVAEVQSTSYVRTQTVRWTTDDLDGGITFAYIPAPYHRLRPVLSPFLGAASIGDWLVGLVAMVGSILAAPLVGPLLEHLLDEYVLGDVVRRRKGRTADAHGEP